MALTRPNTITSLADAYTNRKLGKASVDTLMNLMGVVIDVLSPTRTLTREWVVTFTIQDSDMMKIPVTPKGLKARFFAKTEEELPPTPSVGDIVLIRNCKVTSYKSVPTITNLKGRTSAVVYQPSSIPEPAFMQSFLGEKDIPCLPHDPHPRPSKSEQMYALGLKQLTPSVVNAASTSKPTAIPTGPAAGRAGGPLPPRDKFRLIQNVNYNDYCDLAVEVIKKFPNSNGYMELYVTDYTPNNALYDYPAPNGEDVADEFGRYGRNNTLNNLDNVDNDDNLNRDGDLYGHIPNVTGKRRDWPGPSGRHTLQVELLPPHAGYARDKVEEGSFVKLMNVRIKQGSAGKMEGNMWTDRAYPEKIKIQPLIEEKALKNLTNRRDNYWKANKNRIDEEEAKKQGKKPKRQKKKEQKARKAAIDGDEDPISSTVLVNKHVVCVKHDHVDVSTIGDIQSVNHSYIGKSGLELMLPLNVQYKVRVRVVDFYPPVLEDFASRPPPADASGEDSDNDTDMIDLSSSEKWEWDFYLLLEDIKANRPGNPPAQQWVHVGHRAAEYLLCMDENATDLRSDTRTLAKLREQMAILWGNLEELKVAASHKQQPFPSSEAVLAQDMGLSNLPFYCCIEEYGQELDEEDRPDEFTAYTTLYALTKTRIFASPGAAI